MRGVMRLTREWFVGGFDRKRRNSGGKMFFLHRVAAHGAPDTLLCAVQPAAAGRQLRGCFREAARVAGPQKARFPELAR